MGSGYFFEDLHEGDTFVSGARTVTEADLVAFAGVSGDFNPIHMDAVFSSNGRYGRRVVHGLLGVSIATGLLDRMGIFEGTMVAMLEINEWRPCSSGRRSASRSSLRASAEPATATRGSCSDGCACSTRTTRCYRRGSSP